MPLTLDDRWLPATLTAPPMTDEEFAAFCAEHSDLSFETTAAGELIVMPPTYSKTGARNNEIGFQLTSWARRDRRGVVFELSTGYVLPNSARRSPDASRVPRQHIKAQGENWEDGYLHLCPEFVIELRSKSDRLPTLREKMREYIENGAQLGWLIDPERRSVEIFRPGREPEVREEALSVEGEGPVAGFVLDLAPVWNP
jgi:Uma2 family endonuclease